MTVDAYPAHATPSREQLRGEACIDCGSAQGPFVSAGQVYTRSPEGGRRGWAVVACVRHNPGGAVTTDVPIPPARPLERWSPPRCAGLTALLADHGAKAG